MAKRGVFAARPHGPAGRVRENTLARPMGAAEPDGAACSFARARLGGERSAFGGLEGDRLKTVVARAAVPEIDGAALFFFDPIGGRNRLAALSAGVLPGQIARSSSSHGASPFGAFLVASKWTARLPELPRVRPQKQCGRLHPGATRINDLIVAPTQGPARGHGARLAQVDGGEVVGIDLLPAVRCGRGIWLLGFWVRGVASIPYSSTRRNRFSGSIRSEAAFSSTKNVSAEQVGAAVDEGWKAAVDQGAEAAEIDRMPFPGQRRCAGKV